MNDIPYTPEQAHDHYLEARRLNLSGYWLLRDTDRAICVCNGIGAAWFPEWARELAGKLAGALEPTAWIHDLDYEAGGGWRERWIADWRFLCNGLRAARADYALDQLRRYTTAATALRFWLLLRFFGAPAFNWKGGQK